MDEIQRHSTKVSAIRGGPARPVVRRGVVAAVAWVTRLGPSMEQVNYRLTHGAGCDAVLTPDPEAGDQVQDRQVGYRLDAVDRSLEWTGNGLREVGIEPGTVLGEDAKDAARAIMSGRDPATGTVLVSPKMALDPRGKLPATPLLNAIGDVHATPVAGRAEAISAADKMAGLRLARMTRGVAKEGEAHKIPVSDAARIARAAGLELDEIYGKEKVKQASEFAGRKVRTGNRGYDLTLDLPKSVSVLWALADPVLAARIEAAFTAAVRETVSVVEQWAGYGLAGHHGDGERAVRVESSGLARVADVASHRPPGGRAGTRSAPARARGDREHDPLRRRQLAHRRGRRPGPAPARARRRRLPQSPAPARTGHAGNPVRP
jgi:hypothetical protein